MKRERDYEFKLLLENVKSWQEPVQQTVEPAEPAEAVLELKSPAEPTEPTIQEYPKVESVQLLLETLGYTFQK